MAGLIAAAACTALLVAALVSQRRGKHQPGDNWVGVQHPFEPAVPVNAAAIRAELARTTDPGLRDVLLDKLIEATRSEA